MTIEQLWDLFLKQNRKCKLSGLEIAFAPDRPRLSEGTASIDRIDSSKGYTIDNLQWLHKDINRLKDHFSDERLIKLCKLVAAHNSTN